MKAEIMVHDIALKHSDIPRTTTFVAGNTPFVRRLMTRPAQTC